LAIRRCPYCKAIIDESQKYCNNCGTQLLFPEDDEPIKGEKILDEDFKEAIQEDREEIDLGEVLDRGGTLPGEERDPDLDLDIERPSEDIEPDEFGDIVPPEEAEILPPETAELMKGEPVPSLDKTDLPFKPAGSVPATYVIEEEPVAPPDEPLEPTGPVGTADLAKDEEAEPVKTAETAEIEVPPKAAGPVELPGPVEPAAAETPAPLLELEAPAELEIVKERTVETKDTREILRPAEEEEVEIIPVTAEPTPAVPRIPPTPAPVLSDTKEEIVRLIASLDGKKDLFDEKDEVVYLDVDEPLPSGEDEAEVPARVGTSSASGPTMGIPESVTPRTSPAFDGSLEDLMEKPKPVFDPTAGWVDRAVEEPKDEALEPGEEEPYTIEEQPAEEAGSEALVDDRVAEVREEEPAAPPVEAAPALVTTPPVRLGFLGRIKALLFDMVFVAVFWAIAVGLAARVMSVPVLDLVGGAAAAVILLFLALLGAYLFLFLFFLGETPGGRLVAPRD
jgi:hypothetical protein